MRNNAPINHFPPTPFSPCRSPIYGEAHFYRAQAGWVTRDNAGGCVRAVAVAIKRFQKRLAKAVDAEGRPHPVLQGFSRHLREHLLIPSGRGGDHGGARASWSHTHITKKDIQI